MAMAWGRGFKGFKDFKVFKVFKVFRVFKTFLCPILDNGLELWNNICIFAPNMTYLC